jgi:hypothetical protein
MISDIKIPEVKHVTLAVARIRAIGENDEWRVYLINSNDFAIENTLVASKGYGEKNGEPQRTSILRHFLDHISANSATLIEPIDPALFHLNNEYWVSYYVGPQIFDKRFVFLSDSIREENISYIKELEMEGVLHS